MNIKKYKEKIFFYCNSPQKIYPLIRRKIRRLAHFIIHFRYAPNYIEARISKPSEIINFKPEHIVFYSTDKCNLDCKWCLRNVNTSKAIQHHKMKDLDLRTFKKILELSPYIESISFAGQGEPLLNNDIFDMLDYASRKRIRIYLTTNAILLDDKKIKKIMEYNLVQINLSLKGKDGKEFTETTGMGNELFHKQIENINKMVFEKRKQRSDIVLRISYVIGRDNFRKMEEVIKLAENLHADRLLFDTLVPFHDFEKGTGCIFEDDVEVRDYIEHLKKRPTTVEIEFPVFIKRKDFSYYCPGHYKVINVDAEGNITGCMRVLTPRSEYGNILKDGDYMNNQHFRSLRKMHLDKKLPARCKLCVEMSREKNCK